MHVLVRLPIRQLCSVGQQLRYSFGNDLLISSVRRKQSIENGMLLWDLLLSDGKGNNK